MSDYARALHRDSTSYRAGQLDTVSQLDNPRSKRKALKGKLTGYWRYRVGNYRVICDIMDSQMLVLAIVLGHRRDIYER